MKYNYVVRFGIGLYTKKGNHTNPDYSITACGSVY